jgi:eukaryotic-like serine/threonine-protein kinase
VYACKDEWGNELVAKVLLPRNRSYEEIQQHCLRERERLLELRHPNITFLRECCEYRDTSYLILERCSFTLTPIITLSNLVADLWIR